MCEAELGDLAQSRRAAFRARRPLLEEADRFALRRGGRGGSLHVRGFGVDQAVNAIFGLAQRANIFEVQHGGDARPSPSARPRSLRSPCSTAAPALATSALRDAERLQQARQARRTARRAGANSR